MYKTGQFKEIQCTKWINMYYYHYSLHLCLYLLFYPVIFSSSLSPAPLTSTIHSLIFFVLFCSMLFLSPVSTLCSLLPLFILLFHILFFYPPLFFTTSPLPFFFTLSPCSSSVLHSLHTVSLLEAFRHG